MTKTGRPSKYTQEIANEICERLAEGESLRKICIDEHMPYKATIFRWLAKEEYSEFRDQYAYARDNQADTLADEIIYIADNEPDPNKARVRVDARKWVASKLKPKKYGDKHIVDVGLDGQLAAILSALPEKYAIQVQAALVALSSGKKQQVEG